MWSSPTSQLRLCLWLHIIYLSEFGASRASGESFSTDLIYKVFEYVILPLPFTIRPYLRYVVCFLVVSSATLRLISYL